MQRKRKGNDRQAYQSHIKRQEAYERGWLDDADEEYPDYGEAEAYDTEKMAGLVSFLGGFLLPLLRSRAS